MLLRRRHRENQPVEMPAELLVEQEVEGTEQEVSGEPDAAELELPVPEPEETEEPEAEETKTEPAKTGRRRSGK